MRTENAAPWISFPEDEGSGACALYFVENGVSASKPQWETLRHTYISMTMISKKQDLRDEYLGISIGPRSLGFLFNASWASVVCRASGARIIQHVDSSMDWGGFGMLDSEKDIVTIINGFRSELCTLHLIEKKEP